MGGGHRIGSLLLSLPPPRRSRANLDCLSAPTHAARPTPPLHHTRRPRSAKKKKDECPPFFASCFFRALSPTRTSPHRLPLSRHFAGLVWDGRGRSVVGTTAAFFFFSSRVVRGVGPVSRSSSSSAVSARSTHLRFVVVVFTLFGMAEHRVDAHVFAFTIALPSLRLPRHLFHAPVAYAQRPRSRLPSRSGRSRWRRRFFFFSFGVVTNDMGGTISSCDSRRHVPLVWGVEEASLDLLPCPTACLPQGKDTAPTAHIRSYEKPSPPRRNPTIASGGPRAPLFLHRSFFFLAR